MKLSINRLATSRLATYRDSGQPFVPIEYDGLIANFNQDAGYLIDGLILNFQQSVNDDFAYDGFLCNINQSSSYNFDGLLGSFTQTVKESVDPSEWDLIYPFKTNIFGDFGRFGLSIVGSAIGKIDACKLFENITIKFEEGKASIAEFSLIQNAGTVIDLFELLNEHITIYATRPSQADYVLYQGKISHSIHEVGNRFVKWTATQSREQMINKMTEQQVKNIGYFNENVFRSVDDYKNNLEQIQDRLKTIPASLEFINNTPQLVSWFAKDAADFVLSPCDILRANLSNDVNSQDNVINHVTIKVQYQYDILYHADRSYSFDSGYSVCDYATHGLPPSNDSIRSAIASTGWVLSGYNSVGLHEGGVYYCSWRGGFPAPMIWSPRTGQAYIADPNDPDDRSERTVVNLTDTYANSAYWYMSKRWVQPIEEQINIVKKNTPSIERYEQREDSVTVTIKQDRSESTDRTIKNWDNFNQYSDPRKFGLVKQANGYYTRKLDDIDKGALTQAVDVANRVADCMILESHRTGEVSLTLNSIAPQLDVTQTHSVSTEKLSGAFKVYRIEHTFDCVNKNFSKTSVVYKLFHNKVDSPYQVNQVSTPRANIEYYSNPAYNGRLIVNNIAAGAQVYYSEDEYEEAKASGAVGKISARQQVFYYNLRGLINEESRELNGVKFYQAKEFQIIADEIESESTDDKEFFANAEYEMNVPNDNLILVA